MSRFVGEVSQIERFNWWVPLYAAVGSLIVVLPLTIYGADMTVFLLIPVISFVMLAIAVGRRGQRLSVLLLLIVYWAISWMVLKHSMDIRAHGRWFFHSKKYEAEVLAQADSANGELKHIEWDGSGGFGAGDTVVYLV